MLIISYEGWVWGYNMSLWSYSFITDRFQAIYEMEEESYIAVNDEDEDEDWNIL